MNRRMRINLVLLAAAVLLAALAYFEPGRSPAPQPRKLTAVSADTVDRIDIERRGNDTISLRKRGEAWWIESPFGVALSANALRVKSLLEISDTVSQSSFPAGGKDLKPFGLSEPEIILRLPGASFAFGNTDALNGWRYVLSENTVHLIADTLYWFLSADSATFVGRQLLPEHATLTALQLPQLRLEQVAGRWSVEPPMPNVSADAIQALLESWRRAQALVVEKAEPHSTGETIRVTLKEADAPLEFVLIETEPDVVLVRPDVGLRYRLPGSASGDLLSLRQPDAEPGADPGQ
ncbi:MAG: hypothetical protein AMJ69_00280 [Gammaproteobacteria bacterium SG8_47]|nr:MAG: hypothetical protein AMJ69_00280 [Gammaproteobacteria bacterium SG8_47]